MLKPTLWIPETTLKTITGITPQLASWDKSTYPSQIRLNMYRQPIMQELLPLLPEHKPLFLHLDVDVQKPENLRKHHDLENYLTPLFGLQFLPASRFVLVTARKYVGGGSKLEVGIAQPAENDPFAEQLNHFSYTAWVSVQSKQGKENLRNALAATDPLPLTSPAVEVQIAWICSPSRNWVSLWKPTGDCMGPVLGEENPLRPFAPNDDRITALQFHCTRDVTLGHAVHLDIWWQAASTGRDTQPS